LHNSDRLDSRSDDDGKRKSVESLPSHRNVRLSIRPFDDSDDMMTTSQHNEVDTETAMYSSSGSVVWKSSSSDAVLDVEQVSSERQQRGSATDSCSSDHAPQDNARRVCEREMMSSESSDAVLSSDCSVSSEQSPVHQTDDQHQLTSPCSTAAPVSSTQVVEPTVRLSEVVVLRSSLAENHVDATARSRGGVCQSAELVQDGGGGSSEGSVGGGLLEEIDDHLKQTHGRQLLPTPSMSGSTAATRRSLDDASLVDIDTALAEVMSGLELLGRSRGLSLDHGSMDAPPRQPAACVSSSPPLGRVASPHTPDLVVGLPQFAAGGGSAMSPRPLDVARSPTTTTATAGGHLTTAEMFANVDRATIKKSAASTSAPPSAEIWTSPAGHPLRVVDSPPSVGGGMMSYELSGWSPLRSFGDCDGGGGGVRTRGSPARSQSCRTERQSDQTWSTLWMTSTEIQRDRELVRNVVPQLTAATHQPRPLRPRTSPARDHQSLSFDRADLSSKDAAPLSQSFIVATLPRDSTTGGAKTTPVRVKPPVMKKPVRSAEMMRRLSEYQQHVTDSIPGSTASPK